MVNTQQLASSSVSIIGIISTSICILALILYYLILPSRKRNPLNRVCWYVTFGDLVTSSGLIFGFANDRTYYCEAQAFLTNIGPLWSIFWTINISVIVMIIVYRNPTQPRRKDTTTPTSLMSASYQLTHPEENETLPTSNSQKDLESSTWWHLFCWGWPLILTLLILTTNRYGCGGNAELCWCFIAGRSDSPDWTQAFWTITSFYFWVWSSIIVFTIVFFIALYRCQQFQGSLSKSSVEGVIVRTLLPYPLIIVVCWIFPTIFDVAIAIDPNSSLVDSHLSLVIASVLPTLQGMLTGVIFIRLILRETLVSYAIEPDTTVPSESRQVARVHNKNIDDMITA